MFSMLYIGDAIYMEYKSYGYVQNNSDIEYNSMNFLRAKWHNIWKAFSTAPRSLVSN